MIVVASHGTAKYSNTLTAYNGNTNNHQKQRDLSRAYTDLPTSRSATGWKGLRGARIVVLCDNEPPGGRRSVLKTRFTRHCWSVWRVTVIHRNVYRCRHSCVARRVHRTFVLLWTNPLNCEQLSEDTAVLGNIANTTEAQTLHYIHLYL